MLNKIKEWLFPSTREEAIQKRLDELRRQSPKPVFWLFGKTQSGKTSIIKFLTGAADAEIGQGFKPCTRFSRQYDFPNSEAPLLTFLDTRGLDEPGYVAEEDLARFDALSHVMVVTVKALDHALENLLANLKKIRRAQPSRPVILALTCLHEAYPQQQHPLPYPFSAHSGLVSESLASSLSEQKRRFENLVDAVVPIDLTPVEEGFNEPQYGGAFLKQTLLEKLPSAYRQTLIQLDQATHQLRDLYAQQALPHIIGYSTLAASAGAIPIPWLDLLVIPGIQTRMIYDLARLYGQPLTGDRFLEIAGSLGTGIVVRQAVREVAKFVPVVGSAIGSAMAGAATFALGKAFCFYYSAVHQGQVPKVSDLQKYYQEQLAHAEQFWSTSQQSAGKTT